MTDEPALPVPDNGDKTFTQDELGRILAQDRRERSAGLEEAQARIGELEGELEPLRTRAAALEPLEARSAELDAAVKQRDEMIEGLLISQAVQSQAVQMGAWAPDDVARLLGRDGITVKDGKVTGVDKALEEFAKARPNYFQAPRQPPPDGGARERSTPAKERGMADILQGLRS